MALVSLAVVGRENEPLYLRDFKPSGGSAIGGVAAAGPEADAEDAEDPFGFFSKSEARANDSSSLRHQFIIHAALDRFEEITGSGNRWRTPGATGSNAMWVGLLCPIEDVRVYGYLTNTSIKFMAVIEDGGNSRQPLRESELKSLFASLHDLYVEYTLNPFSQLRGKISSKRFDDDVGKYVDSYNSKVAKVGEKYTWA
eukprot:CAMPEP_0183296030 /NCGR_PEP_ID=MMETSP0160_2-20130417/3759_1 /TAXON_ID=2839 ORGANISM="Odontella Sinensis, Strain Grunow 1884" /NCGR_SAMPLE_ID=MMETSP0160_2 /ASSEMBLY_ACC=CAM_ASM_000250 /LENGTH=197 /DNA_ID=CAMNT_0025457597 /DNA_START=42 /DNA_END=635 /DNA_ORIENTATION=+